MTEPTRGHLERALSQRIQALYRSKLGHQPSKVTCQLNVSVVDLMSDATFKTGRTGIIVVIDPALTGRDGLVGRTPDLQA